MVLHELYTITIHFCKSRPVTSFNRIALIVSFVAFIGSFSGKTGN